MNKERINARFWQRAIKNIAYQITRYNEGKVGLDAISDAVRDADMQCIIKDVGADLINPRLESISFRLQKVMEDRYRGCGPFPSAGSWEKWKSLMDEVIEVCPNEGPELLSVCKQVLETINAGVFVVVKTEPHDCIIEYLKGELEAAIAKAEKGDTP